MFRVVPGSEAALPEDYEPGTPYNGFAIAVILQCLTLDRVGKVASFIGIGPDDLLYQSTRSWGNVDFRVVVWRAGDGLAVQAFSCNVTSPPVLRLPRSELCGMFQHVASDASLEQVLTPGDLTWLVARLQQRHTGTDKCVLEVVDDGSHHGAAGGFLKEQAFRYPDTGTVVRELDQTIGDTRYSVTVRDIGATLVIHAFDKSTGQHTWPLVVNSRHRWLARHACERKEPTRPGGLVAASGPWSNSPGPVPEAVDDDMLQALLGGLAVAQVEGRPHLMLARQAVGRHGAVVLRHALVLHQVPFNMTIRELNGQFCVQGFNVGTGEHVDEFYPSMREVARLTQLVLGSSSDPQECVTSMRVAGAPAVANFLVLADILHSMASWTMGLAPQHNAGTLKSS